ncbi:MAG: Spy/CpxP family protein refolding chaperone [Pseudolabrys sp.]
MTRKIVKALVTTVSLAALVLGTDPSMAKGGGGGHFGGGGGHFGGGGGHFGGGGARFSGAHFGGGGARFSGAHFGGARFSGTHFGGARMGTSRFSAAHISGRNFSGRNFSGRNFSRVSRGNFARVNAAHVGAAALGTRAAWNHGAWNQGNWNHAWNHWGNNWRGGWNGGCCGGWWWGGPVFWPFFAGDLLAFTFWPWGFYDPFWAYGNMFVWDAMFWPGPQYTYGGPYDDVYGGYAYGGPARTRVARRVAPETTGSVTDTAELAQSCGGLAPGVTDLPIDKIQQSLQLNDDQLKSLNALKAASSQASEALKASCSGELSLTPLGRLDTVQKRLDGMVQAWGTLRTPLDGFYNSLNDEQRQRFAALGPASSERVNRRRPASGDNLAALCSSRAESFTQLPVQRVEQAVKPTQQQQDALAKLKAASTEAANQLQASCPAQSPQTPIDRFDAVGKRLNAMAGAIKTVRPALADFYSSLTDEQKARFNNLKSPEATPSRPG